MTKSINIIPSDYFVAQWQPMTTNPPQSGKFVVAHRGAMYGSARWNGSRWLDMPDWSPTHWLWGGDDALKSAIEIVPSGALC